LPYNIIHALRLCCKRVVYTCVFSTAPPCTYPSSLTEKSRRWGQAVVHTVGSGKHLRQRPSTAGFPPLRDPVYDSAMGVNATTIIDSPRRRLVRSSTSRSRFRTQAHHLRQALARYPSIHYEKFDLRLSPMATQLPPHGPMLNAELLGFTLWCEYMLL